LKAKLVIFSLIILLIFSGCATNSAPDLTDEPIEQFKVIKSTDNQDEIIEEQSNQPTQDLPLEEKFSTIDFYLVSGIYSRKVLQGEIEYTEMFSLDKNSFIRIASNELEQEVFAYNYVSDDFTYLYYFDNEMLSKTIFNIDTGAVLQDSAGYAELLTKEAEELKIYFYDLMGASGLNPTDL
jgi:hypothetical protein